jgi:membrane-bound inhibitor of C-type lysozyme
MKSRFKKLAATVAWRRALIVALSVTAITGCSQRTSPDQASEARGKVSAAAHDALGNADARPSSDAEQTAAPACEPTHLALALDGGDGRFNGMSHSGTSLVLSNSGTVACAVPARPKLGFTDPGGKVLDITAGEPAAQAADVRPLTLAPDATITSDLRWISGDVFDHGHCVSPTRLTLTLGSETLSTAFDGHLCGEAGKPISYTLASFKPAAPTIASAAASATIYACQDGRRVQAVYPDSDTVELVLEGHIHRLHTAVSADGARYVGDHWQWWVKGMRHAQLAPLKNGESIASALGTACTAP